ncbi:hypothetical protein FRC11_014041 [Ceratobasidium sp. 423]|nr:hypothetical protein FRC11_014041 [Ceratobasidium sp. 423]
MNFSLVNHNNAVECAAVHGFTAKFWAPTHLPLPTPNLTTVSPVFTGSSSLSPSTLIDKRDELLDLMHIAIYSIYIKNFDFSKHPGSSWLSLVEKPRPDQYQVQAAAPPPTFEGSPMRWFLTELFCRSHVTPTVIQLALHYLKQAHELVREILYRQIESSKVSSKVYSLVDPRKLVLAAIMLSDKILNDHALNNHAWSKICGLEVDQLNACERALGRVLNWELMHTIVGPGDISVLFG